MLKFLKLNFMSFLFDLKLQFWHGDWFAAKGIGVCQIDYQGFDIHLYISHYHANYHPNHDIYLSHRVSHAFESAQWIKLASSAAGRLIDLISLRIALIKLKPYLLEYHVLFKIDKKSVNEHFITADQNTSFGHISFLT